MKTFFINIRTQFGNSGDALINRELIKELRNHGEVRAYCGPDVDKIFIEDLELTEKEMVTASSVGAFAFCLIKCALLAVFTGEKVYSVGGAW